MIEQLSYFLAASMRMAAPLLIAGLGLVISELAGLMNIGVEGIMLMGAFTGYTVAKITGSYWLGLFAAMLIGVLMISIFAVTSITYRAQQVVVGAGINILGAGISSFLFRKIFYGTGQMDGGFTVETFEAVPIPLLSDIPLIGPMLFNQNIIVYFGLIMVLVLTFIKKKTSIGLKCIAVGDHPKAADSLGINVNLTRYVATLFSGLMIGVSGAYLSIAQTNAFAEGMTSGKGYIAMAVVILGKWSPIGVLLGALIFGSASALQMSIQNFGLPIPTNFILMIPYIVTIIAVVLVSKNKVGAPRAQGVPFQKS